MDEISKTIQEAYVNNVNRLLWQFKIDRRISSLQDCSPSMFIVLYERMLQERIPGIVRFPHYPEDHHSNMTLLLYHLQTIFGRHFSVGHIEARRVNIERHIPSICALIEILDHVAYFVIDQSYRKARRKRQIGESDEESTVEEEIPLLPRRDISILASDRSRSSWSSSPSSLDVSPRSSATPLDWNSHSGSSYLHSKLNSGLSDSLEEQDSQRSCPPVNSDQSGGESEIDEHISDSEPASSSLSYHSTCDGMLDSEDERCEAEVEISQEVNTKEISLFGIETENSSIRASTSKSKTSFSTHDEGLSSEWSISNLQRNSSSSSTINSLYDRYSSSRDLRSVRKDNNSFTNLTISAASLGYKSINSDDKIHHHEQNTASMRKSMGLCDTNHITSTSSFNESDTTEDILSQFEEKLERKKRMLGDTVARRSSEPGISTSIEKPQIFRTSLPGNLNQKIFTVKDSHGQTISSINIDDQAQANQIFKESLRSHITTDSYNCNNHEEVGGQNLEVEAPRIGLDDLKEMLLTFLAKRKVSEKRKVPKCADKESTCERGIESDSSSSTDNDSDDDDDDDDYFSTSESDEDFDDGTPSDFSSSRNKLNLSVGDEPRSASLIGRKGRNKRRIKSLRRSSSAPKHIPVPQIKKPVENSTKRHFIEEKLRQKRTLQEIVKRKKDEDDSFFTDIRRLKEYRLKLHENQSVKKRYHRNTALQSTKSSYSRISKDKLWKYKQEYREQLQRRVEEILSQERSFKDRHKFSLKSMERERRLEERRQQLFQEDHERLMRSTIAQRRSVEEQTLRRLMKTVKRLEKEKMIADQARIKEFQVETAKRDKLRFGSVEKFYCDQIQMLREQILVARRDRMMAEKAQRFELDKMAREVRQEIWDQMNRMREQWRSEEEAKYFRARLSDEALRRLLSSEI